MHNLLGVRLVDTSIGEAIAHFREAARLNPDLLEAHNNLCLAVQHLGNPDEAIAECSTAIRLNPKTPTAHNGLGLALLSKGRANEARVEFEAAGRPNADYAEAHTNLANVLASTGHESEAIEHYRQALAIAPQSVDARKTSESRWTGSGSQTKPLSGTARHFDAIRAWLTCVPVWTRCCKRRA